MTTPETPPPQRQTAQEYRDKRNTQALQDTNEQLAEAERAARPTLSEAVFKGVFLPFFAGDANPKYPMHAYQWIHVATSPFKKVDVIDDRTKQVLFSVPPIFDRDAVNVSAAAPGKPITHIIASANQYANITPQAGANYLSEKLDQRAMMLQVKTNMIKHAQAWNEIFARYGRPPLVVLDPVVATQSEAPQPPGDEPLEYEPL